jgi:hypothetical protein
MWHCGCENCAPGGREREIAKQGNDTNLLFGEIMLARGQRGLRVSVGCWISRFWVRYPRANWRSVPNVRAQPIIVSGAPS